MKLSSMIAAVLLAGTAAAQAGTLNFYTNFAPDAGSLGTGSGSALVNFDDVTHVLSFAGNFSGLSGNTTQAHFHCCTAVPFTGNSMIAVDTPSLPSFMLGVKSGAFDSSLDLDVADNFNPDFLIASGGSTDSATTRLINAFYAGTAYLNIHTSTFLRGEIRGFLQVPEPSSALLAGLSLAALAFTLRKRSA